VDRGPTPKQHQVRTGGGVLHRFGVPNSIITDNDT
jgi:transposase InsO family protein